MTRASVSAMVVWKGIFQCATRVSCVAGWWVGVRPVRYCRFAACVRAEVARRKSGTFGKPKTRPLAEKLAFFLPQLLVRLSHCRNTAIPKKWLLHMKPLSVNAIRRGSLFRYARVCCHCCGVVHRWCACKRSVLAAALTNGVVPWLQPCRQVAADVRSKPRFVASQRRRRQAGRRRRERPLGAIVGHLGPVRL